MMDIKITPVKKPGGNPDKKLIDSPAENANKNLTEIPTEIPTGQPVEQLNSDNEIKSWILLEPEQLKPKLVLPVKSKQIHQSGAKDEALDLWGLDKDFPLARYAADFYILYRIHSERPKVHSNRIRVEYHAAMMSTQMSRYMDAASGGELRHSRYDGEPEITAYLHEARTLNRWQSWAKWKQYRDKYGIQILKQASEVFSMKGWSSSFGGKKWANVVNVLVGFLENRYSPIRFIDHAFGVEHNCGPVFDKLWATVSMRKIYGHAFQGDTESLCMFASKEVVELYEHLD